MGDTKLDWYGAESGQGSYDGQPADPMVWTTDDPGHPGYQEDNRYGNKCYWRSPRVSWLLLYGNVYPRLDA